MPRRGSVHDRMSHYMYERLNTDPEYSVELQELPAFPPNAGEDCLQIQRADVLQWFHRSKEADAVWVLDRLVETMPNLVFAAVAGKMQSSYSDPGASPEPSIPSIASARERSPKKSPGGSLSARDLPADPILQFTTSVFYATEGVDDIMVLDVMRIGDERGTSEVYFETQDDSALNGRSYVATAGKLVFDPGDSLAHIEIPIIDNPLWDTTIEFKCHLKADGLKGAVLSHHGHQARVKIIDNDHFPTGDFKHLVSEDDIDKCNKWHLLGGFLIMVCNIPGVWSGTMKYMLVDAFHNLWYFFGLLMSVYTLDYILDKHDSVDNLVFVQDEFQSLILCSIVTVTFMALSHVLDYMRISFTIYGPARSFLQRSLLRKFLNYKNTVREHLIPGKVMMSMETNVDALISKGYLNLLRMCKALGRMALMLCFNLFRPFVFGGKTDWRACVFLVVVPLLLVLFLQTREGMQSRLLIQRNRCHSACTNQISTTTNNYHLVIDYNLRHHCEQKFVEKEKLYGQAAKNVIQVNENNTYFCKWCEVLLITSWLLYGGVQVLQGSVKLGLFATNLQLFESFGKACLEIYVITMEMMNTFPALQQVTTLMNYPTDVAQKYGLEKKRRAKSEAQRVDFQRSPKSNGTTDIVIDMMPIVLDFQSLFKFEGSDRKLNFVGRVEIFQGELIAVIGSLGSGKATLLRLIAGSVLPSDTGDLSIFVPSHLRLANVADDPVFFSGTLYDNLTFGMDPTKPDASRERVKSICRRLTKSHIITDYLDVAFEQRWTDVFSGSQSKLLSIARALVLNHDVLCIHKPLSKLTHNDAEHVMLALHDHVSSRGLGLMTGFEMRRPRTVVLSAATDRAVQEAHNLLKVDMHTGIKLLFPR